jgi:DNA topoisomerase-2
MVVNEELIVNKRKKSELEKELEENKFPKLGNKNNSHGESYDYLLGMPIYQLTHEKIEELKKLEKNRQTEYDDLYKMKPHDIWRNELIELKEELNKSEIKTDKTSIKKKTK